MTDDPLDLKALDPTADRARFDQLIGRLVAAAEPVLARRKRLTAVDVVVAWRVPILAAAAVLLMVGVVLNRIPESEPGFERVDVAQAIGIPDQVAGWLDTPPTPVDLLTTLGGDVQ